MNDRGVCVALFARYVINEELFIQYRRNLNLSSSIRFVFHLLYVGYVIIVHQVVPPIFIVTSPKVSTRRKTNTLVKRNSVGVPG